MNNLRPLDERAPVREAGSRRVPPATDVAVARLWTELVHVAALGTHATAWTDLCARAVEANIFLDPAFALPLFQHAGRADAPRFLLVWEENGPTTFGRLVGLFPLVAPRRRGGTCRVPRHEQTSAGTPLVDRDRAAEVVEIVLTWLGGDRAPRAASALALSSVTRDGPFVDVLRRVCASSARPIVVLEDRSRAVLHRPQGDEARIVSFASARRRKQYARQARRLARTGDRVVGVAATASEVAAATERFLLLEQGSWKGARGTALLASASLATFVRTMTRMLAEDGRCRIDSVEIDGRPVAMGIVLVDAGRAHFWKTAFDEGYALYSPGVQLALDVTRRHLADPAIALTDSCTDADHPVIDRIWPDRLAMSDLLVGVAPGGGGRFVRCLLVERSRRRLRQMAKDLWLRSRRWARRLKRSRRRPISG